jgi:hypothetical protein
MALLSLSARSCSSATWFGPARAALELAADSGFAGLAISPDSAARG